MPTLSEIATTLNAKKAITHDQLIAAGRLLRTARGLFHVNGYVLSDHVTGEPTRFGPWCESHILKDKVDTCRAMHLAFQAERDREAESS